MAEVIVLGGGLVALDIVTAMKHWREHNMSIPKEYEQLVAKFKEQTK